LGGRTKEQLETLSDSLLTREVSKSFTFEFELILDLNFELGNFSLFTLGIGFIMLVFLALDIVACFSLVVLFHLEGVGDLIDSAFFCG